MNNQNQNWTSEFFTMGVREFNLLFGESVPNIRKSCQEWQLGTGEVYAEKRGRNWEISFDLDGLYVLCYEYDNVSEIDSIIREYSTPELLLSESEILEILDDNVNSENSSGNSIVDQSVLSSILLDGIDGYIQKSLENGEVHPDTFLELPNEVIQELYLDNEFVPEDWYPEDVEFDGDSSEFPWMSWEEDLPSMSGEVNISLDNSIGESVDEPVGNSVGNWREKLLEFDNRHSETFNKISVLFLLFSILSLLVTVSKIIS